MIRAAHGDLESLVYTGATNITTGVVAGDPQLSRDGTLLVLAGLGPGNNRDLLYMQRTCME